MFLVEILENHDLAPLGCADTFENALKILKGKSGRISTLNKSFLIMRG